MNISSADFTKMTLQEVADMLIDRDCHGVMCKGMVEDDLYTLKVELIREDNDE